MQNPDEPAAGGEPQHDSPSAALTRRQQEVAGLLALGLETPAIAKALHISEHTVRAHVRNAMEKVGGRTRGQLVALILRGDPDASYLWWPSKDE